jgi:hypothetical protein
VAAVGWLEAGAAPIGAAVLETAGVTAIFTGRESPLTQGFGLGMRGAPELAAWDRLEDFFHRRGAAAAFEVCELVEPAVVSTLQARGYRPIESSVVLARPASGGEAAPALQMEGVEIRAAESEERVPLARLVMDASGATDRPLDPGIEALFSAPALTVVVAVAGNRLLGGGLLHFHGRTAVLSSTAVTPGARGRGLHAGLIQARLALARARGAETAMVVAEPGTTSHRNAERSGFTAQYQRRKYIRE